MRQRIKVGFDRFWTGFFPDIFAAFFPQVAAKYELVPAPDPQIIFFSVFAPGFVPYVDQRRPSPFLAYPRGNYVRVFITGENVEPDMTGCDLAITFSALTAHPNHLWLPLWVYENNATFFRPDLLIRPSDTDWDEVTARKTRFCNFVYTNEMPFRNKVFTTLNAYRKIDAAGKSQNNMGGWQVPLRPSRMQAKLAFLKDYKFTLAVENAIWPGYMTEKLVDPMYVNSIPIYLGDPLARLHFDTNAYIDFTSFISLREMIAFVREVDNNRDLYLKILSTPVYRGNVIPQFARDDTILAFFDKIVAAANAPPRA
jgi:hypothetical protein